MHTKPKTINDALNLLWAPTMSEIERWMLLSIILREFMLEEGVDIDLEIED